MIDTTTPGVIDEHSVYSIDEFRRRTRLREWAVRTARKNGLSVKKIGGRLFVSGRDFIRYLDAQDNKGN